MIDLWTIEGTETLRIILAMICETIKELYQFNSSITFHYPINEPLVATASSQASSESQN